MSYALATVETWYSILRSTIAPQALLDAAQRLKLPAIGIVDQATTLGHVPVAKAARDSGVHVAFGVTITLEDGFPLRLLARNDTGYRNLCRLVSLQAASGARLPHQALHDHRAGLYLLAGGRQGRLWQALVAGDERIVWLLARLQALAEHEDRFIVEIQHDPDDEPHLLPALLDLVERAGVRAIATHNVQVLEPAEAPKHRLLGAIGHQLSFWSDDTRLPFWREPSRAALPTPADWHRRWEGLEHLVAGAGAVLADCQVALLGKRRFPGASLPANRIYDALWSRAFAGLKARYGEVRPELIERLAHEVTEVMAQEVGPFLLHAAELVERAQRQGIKMILQGSGTGSLLCFALGISPVDPLTTGETLIFERFAGKHRGLGDLPDLDFAVAAGRETEVRALLQEMFGSERVAFLCAVVTLQERGANRTAASAFGWDRAQIRLLHRKLKCGAELDRQEQMVVNAGAQIAGQPAHLMRHASGVIVADEPLADLYGVGSCPDGSMLLANRDDVEALQLLKFDILVWYVLAIYDQAEASIHNTVYPKPDLWHVPGHDDRTGDLLEHADTRSIPGLQSPACMTIVRALRVRTEVDIALALGALRPGASHTRERLVAAIHGGTAVLPGWEQLTPAHQTIIEEVLAPSHGALIFDEDFLRVAHVMGLSYADAERLRKALGRGEQDAPIVNQFRAAALASGWSDREIAVVLHWFQYIRRYTYTRGHAMAMAFVAWRVARIAVYYPAHFFAAVIDNLGLGVAGGMYPLLVYVVEARRHVVGVVGPSINGPWRSTPDGHVVRCGLRVLQGVINEATLERIHAAAREQAFTSVTDLCTRVMLTPAELERLIAAGAVDDLVLSRRHARWEAQFARGRSRQQHSLLDEGSWPMPDVIEAEPSWERAMEEYATLGFPISTNHPLDLYEVGEHQVRCAEQLAEYVGRRVVVAGVVVAGRRIKTTTGRAMAFASLCDRSGVLELTLFDQVAQRYRERLQVGMVLRVTGVVTHTDERGVGVEVQTLAELQPQHTLQGSAVEHEDA